ncbi:MAG TPA: helix-hairpin-helix domain-containing protein [Lapillicoccus sp.]|jgi:competence protein ComEA|uniref:helix-hairpin-helix domain-containing protein n=1 Tax=Lapillicoccus sp. TaxID=1909287 RepID=UPI002F944FA1
MRRRPPPEVDPDRLRSLLASARPRPAPTAPSGWVPEEAPASVEAADLAWLDEEALEASGGPERGGSSAGDGPSGGRSGSAGDGRHRLPPRVLTVPVAFRGARVAVSVRAVVAFVLVLVVAVVFFAVRVARAQQAAAPQSVPTGEGLVARGSVPTAFASGGSGGSGGSGEFAATVASGANGVTGAAGANGGSAGGGAAVIDPAQPSGASARGSPGRLVVIDVVGQVARPGVVTVPDGSRLVDVLAAAGGALAGADMQRLNLARLVADGEQVFVPRPGETPPVLVGALGGAGSGSGAGGAGTGAGGATVAGALVDLNTATLAALDTLPGVGPVLAQRIVDWRAQHGRFASVDELGEVSGIGDKLLEQIRPKVRV